VRSLAAIEQADSSAGGGAPIRAPTLRRSCCDRRGGARALGSPPKDSSRPVKALARASRLLALHRQGCGDEPELSTACGNLPRSLCSIITNWVNLERSTPTPVQRCA